MKILVNMLISGLLCLNVNAAPGESKPAGITGFYSLLVNENKIENIIVHKGSSWIFNGEPTNFNNRIQGIKVPVVDQENGYMKYSYSFSDGACYCKTELALFIGSKEKKYIAVSNSCGCIEGAGYNFHIFEYSAGNKFTEITDRMIQLSRRDFFIISGITDINDFQKGLADSAPYLSIHYTLPQFGTTVTAGLSAYDESQVGSDTMKIRAANAFLKKYKRFSKIELKWNSDKDTFEISSRQY